MMKRGMGMMLGAAAVGLAMLSGCRSTAEVENTVALGVVNKVWIAHVTSECTNKDFPKNFYVEPASAAAKAQYVDEVVKYTQNGLAGLELTQLKKPDDKALLVKVDFGKRGERRLQAYYTATATVGGKQVWSVTSRCSGSEEYFRNYLPGLVAAAMPNVGKTISLSLTNIRRHMSYLKAVMGQPEPKEQK